MSAFTNLLMFANELTPAQSKRFLDLLSAHHEEEQRQLSILRAELSSGSKPFEVVAIAGTAEQLLTDVINVGDTVELNPEMQLTTYEKGMFYSCNIKLYGKYIVEDVFVKNEINCVVINGRKLTAKYFRKVSAPIVNPLNSVEGC